jgi:hypothetical protein
MSTDRIDWAVMARENTGDTVAGVGCLSVHGHDDSFNSSDHVFRGATGVIIEASAAEWRLVPFRQHFWGWREVHDFERGGV